MLLPNFKAAQLPTPGGRGPDPSWLQGIAPGKVCFLLGGAGGLVESSGLARAEGEIVIGSNWTLRALVPTIWMVVDPDVWKSERGRLVGCPASMVVVIHDKLFGGGPYSTKGSRMMRMVGKGFRPTTEISIERPPRGHTGKDRVYRPGWTKPFLPKRITDPFHPSGNSLCYMLQLAHLMGCNPIYLLGFTLTSGSPYFFGATNPATRRPSFYSDPERALTWLRWYNEQNPGRVKLWPGWPGRLQEVFDEAEAGHEPDPQGGDGDAAE